MIGARATRDMQTFLEAASSGATVELVGPDGCVKMRHEAPLIVEQDVFDLGGDAALAEIIADIRALRELVTAFHAKGHLPDAYRAVRVHTEAARKRMDAYVNGGHKCGPHGGA